MKSRWPGGTLVLALAFTTALGGEAPPEIQIAPTALHESLLSNETSTRALHVANAGGSPLEVAIEVRTAPPHPAPDPFPEDPVAPPPGALFRNAAAHDSALPKPAGTYTGAHLRFGVTSFGEVMPFQRPIGNEHLEWGSYFSGYTLAYVVQGELRVAYAGYQERARIQPVSFRTVLDTPTVVQVQVETATTDGVLQLLQIITFHKDTDSFLVQARVVNLSGGDVSNVVLKWFTDWDVDGEFVNTWDYDRARNMVLASQGTWVGVAGVDPPALMDLDGWEDYWRASTFVDFPTGPQVFDGMGLLHFALGSLGPAGWRETKVVFAASPDLGSLRRTVDLEMARARWLRLDENVATIPAGSSLDLQLTFDATGLLGGDYDADLVVTSNDLPRSPQLVPVRLHVTGVPDVDVSPASLDFGSVFVDGSATRTATVSNPGTDVLTVTAVSSDDPAFLVDPSGFSLAPGGSRTLTVTFAPSEPGAATAVLALASNDPDEPVRVLPMAGVGLIPPDVAVFPAAFSESLFSGQTVTRSLFVENSGGSDLTFGFGVEAAGAAAPPRPVEPPPLPAVDPLRPYAPRSTSFEAAAPASDPPPAPRSGLSVLLLHGGADVASLRAMLLAFPDIGVVDTFDARVGTPSLAVLTSHEAVLVANGFAFYDRTALGNVLADYVDEGGGVVQTLASWVSTWSIGGRFYAQAYGPFLLGDGPLGDSVLGTYDAAHPIMRGVASAYGNLLGTAPLAAGAHLVASWSNGLPFVATQGRSVAAVNVYVASPGYWAGDVPLVLHNALQWSATGRFLHVEPSSGSVPAGTTREIAITFDAARLNGGDYDAVLVLGSNDPDEPEVRLPAHLHVTGAPDVAVAPAALDFGAVFLGGSAARTVTVTNDGTDVLHVASVSFDHPDFTADAAAFALDPGQARTVTVTFAPTAPVSVGASLTLVSDDPDEPSLSVTLAGVGLVPPDIAVSPEAFSEALFTGETVTRTLTVENTGGSDLSFQLGVQGTELAPALVGRTLLLQTIDPWGSTAIPSILQSAGILFDVRSASVLGSLDLTPYRHVIVASDQPQSFYTALAANWARLETWVRAGGTLEFHAAAWGYGGGDASGITLPGGMHIFQRYADFNHVAAPGHPLMAGIPEPFPGNAASHASFSAIPATATVVATDDQGTPNLVVYRFGAGLVIAGGQTFEFGFPGSWPSRILANMIPWAGQRTTWLTVSPEEGTIPAGETLPIQVTFDADGMLGGGYDADLVVTSNDPDEGALSLPVHLQVTGAPDADVSPTELVFGTVFVGGSAARTLSVTNQGTDVLHVTGVAFDDPVFSADVPAFDLTVGGSRTITVTFAPSAPLDTVATMTLESDDPDEPSLPVPLSGSGRIAPDIAVAPDSFDEALFTGQSVTRTLTLENLGGSDLAFSLAVQEVAPAPAALRVLLVYSLVDVDYLRGLLLAFPEVTSVDTFDAHQDTPTLALLSQYPVVLLANVDVFQDPTALGNVLADYVDGGGAVVQTVASFSYLWSVEGRFVAESYSPFASGSDTGAVGSLGDYDAEHPIMHGVFAASGQVLAYNLFLSPGAQLVASWSNQLPFVATQRDRVVGVNAFIALPGYFGGDVPRIVVNALGWAARPRFLSAEPLSGVVLAGGAAEIALTFDAAGVNGGDYDAFLVVSSNDPDEPEEAVPAHLHVTGAPDVEISTTALDFGPVFVGGSAVRTLVVANRGTDVLHVTGVLSDHPAFHAELSSFDVPIGQSREVTVTFAPLVPEAASATLTLASDDPDEPAVPLSLAGIGEVAPDISVSPASFDEDLFTGDTVTRLLTIENTGGSDLTFSASVKRSAPAASMVGAQTLLVLETLPWESMANQNILTANGIAFDTVSASGLDGLDLSRYRHLIVASDQTTFFYADLAARRARIDAWVAGGGVLEFHAGGWGFHGGDSTQVTLPGDVHIMTFLTYTNYVVAPGHPLVEGVPNPFFGSYVSHASFVDVPAGTTVIAADDYGNPSLVVYRFGGGLVVAGGQTFEYGNGHPPNTILANMIPWAHAVVPWLTLDVTEGVVPPGASRQIQVTFDATSMNGGDDVADLVVESNDPDEPSWTVPAHLHVTGAPDVEVAPSSLDFGTIYVGASAQREVTVRNTGSDVLTVAAITFDEPAFTADAGAFALGVGESRLVTVTFAPSAPLAASATLTLACDDPDQPSVPVLLTGHAIVAPDVAVSPASFSESLFAGDSVTRTLTVENRGGSPLSFDVTVDAETTFRVLLVYSGGDVEHMRQVVGLPEMDTFNAGYGTPTPAGLAPYDAVLLANESPFADSNALGDLLADYVDGGGAVVQTIASFTSNWKVGGRFLFEGYAPFTPSEDFRSGDFLGDYDAAHPIMNGVQTLNSSFLTYAPLTAGARTVASWSTGWPAVATQGSQVVGINLFVTRPGYASGDVGLLLRNALRWGAAGDFLRATPRSGVVPAGEARSVALTFASAGLMPGDYNAALRIATNDPDQPEIPVPAHLHVIGAPDVGAEPAALAFGPVFVGGSSMKALFVINAGSEPLDVSGVTIDRPGFTTEPFSFTLGVGESRAVPVTFAPTAPGTVSATLTIESDDPDEPTFAVPLSGEGMQAPDIAIHPAALTEVLAPGAGSSRTVTVSNTGEGALTFHVRTPESLGAGAGVLLLTAGADVDALRAELAGYPDLSTVDVFDATQATPSLDNLLPYQATILIAGLREFNQPDVLGDVLADYVDLGGGVVLTFSSFVAGWEVGGRFGEEDAPFTLATTLTDLQTLGTFEAGHTIFQGVSSVGGFPSDVGAAEPSHLVASWADGTPFVATRPHVAGVNAYVAAPGTWTGDLVLVLHNAALWAAEPEVRWMTVEPRLGEVAPGGSLPLTVTLDASQLTEGSYTTFLEVESNDPDEAILTVPVSLTVASCVPTFEVCNGADDDCDGAVDEDLAPVSCGVGACRRTVVACVAGVPQTCTPGAPRAETCNGVDDDCDGAVDDGVRRLPSGRCQQTVGGAPVE